MIELFPQGFEEVDKAQGSERAAYTDAAGEERPLGVLRQRAKRRRRDRLGGQVARVPSTDSCGSSLGRSAVGGAALGCAGRDRGSGSRVRHGLSPDDPARLQTLQELEPGPLLDVGCGSGCCRSPAALLGFAPVLGVDIEEPSIEATLENARANGVTVDAKLVAGDEQLPSSPLRSSRTSRSSQSRRCPRAPMRAL